MLAALVRFAIRFPGIVVCLAVLILLYGSYRLATVGLDIFPEFAPKRVVIQTEASGLSAEQVELLITQRIEASINGLMGLESVRSESIQGLSVITAIFNEKSDIYRNRQLINERLTSIQTQLPVHITPSVIPLSSSSATVLTLGIDTSEDDLLNLRSLVDWTLVPRLLSIAGVADVNVFGGDIKQLQIQFHPELLRHFGITPDDIAQVVSAALPFQGGGFIENSNQRFTLQIVNHDDIIERIKQLRIGADGILLETLAQISYAPEPPISAAQIMAKRGVVLMVIAQYGANTLSVSRQIEQVLEDMRPLLIQNDRHFHPHLFRPADYIERSIHNLLSHLLLGGLFVVIVLSIFLFNLRTAFISALAIPVSLMAAILVLLLQGVSLNIMALGGLAIALGEVVDDAIIDTENIFRRLRQCKHSESASNRQMVADVVYHASLEVRSSVVYASFIVALVFIPLLTLQGVAGRLFAPLGYSYILAILMSLLVALTLTPALCYLLLNIREHRDPPLLIWLQDRYQYLLRYVIVHFRRVVTISLVLCGLSLLSFIKFDSQFLPQLREGHYIVHTTSVPGTSLEESLRIGKQLITDITQVDGVESMSQWAGRSSRGADTYGSHYSEYEVRLKPLSGKQQQRVMEQIRACLQQVPGILFEVNTFLTERIDETISGYTAPVVVNIYGNTLDELDQQAQQVATLMRSMRGASDVQLRSPPSTPLLAVEVKSNQLNFFHITLEEIQRLIKTAYETEVVGKIVQGKQLIDVALALDPQLRQDPTAIESLPLRNAQGQMFSLSEFADFHHGSSRYNVLHQNAQRRQSISCQVIGRDWDDFTHELKTRMQHEIHFADNSYPEVTGSAIEQAKARQELIIDALLAGTGVLILIYMAIGHVRHVLLTLVNLPFALVGGVIAVALSGNSLSVGSIVGFITLFGITVRNSIMLIAHYRHLVEEEHCPWNLDTVVQGAQERLPSILMTALVTALAMLPLIGDNAGQEIMSPMAAIIIGGLASSTLLNLLLLPAMLLRYGHFQRWNLR